MEIRKIMSKKSQSATGATLLILIIAITLIVYIMLLPSEERESLLNENVNGGNYQNPESKGNTEESYVELLNENIGRLIYEEYDKRTYDLNSFRIEAVTEAKSIKNIDSLYLKNSLFEKVRKNLTFSLDKELSESLLLTFNVKEAKGVLNIYLNGYKISERKFQEGNIEPINLPEDQLRNYNIIKFEVSKVGWAFWRTNYYLIENIRVIGDIKDITNSVSQQSFYTGDIDKEDVEEVTLKFYPGCDIDETGKLKIELNGHDIFEGMADCGMRNQLNINPDYLYSKDNLIEFRAEEGSYIIDNIEITIDFMENVNPVYYFELGSEYFESGEEEDIICGEKDDKCPSGCSSDRDINCCFDDGNNYWCDLPTSNMNDRCVGYVYESQCGRCPSGYEDRYGEAPDNCEGMCGDDNDDECNCYIYNGKYYDKDCCYEDNPDNYWCNEVPVTGLSYTCTASVEGDQCKDCPSGYKNEDGDRPECYYEEPSYKDEILDKYDVTLTITFTNKDERKRAEVIVNGYTFFIDTYELSYSRKIDDYVREDTNSIEINPKSDMDIAELKVEIE